MGMQFGEDTKKPWIFLFKRVDFVVSELYLKFFLSFFFFNG